MSPERRKYMVWVVSESRRKLKLRAVEYKGGGCLLCGYKKCVAALVFHHLDDAEKEFGVGSRLLAWERVKAEADKCILVCANCHAEIHAEEAERERTKLEAEVRALVPERQETPHGVASRYTAGCRCPECKAAHAKKHREYRASKM
jgi:hypothetical protein